MSLEPIWGSGLIPNPVMQVHLIGDSDLLAWIPLLTPETRILLVKLNTS